MNKLVLVILTLTTVSCHMNLFRDFGVNKQHTFGINRHSHGLHRFLSQMEQMQTLMSAQVQTTSYAVDAPVTLPSSKYDQCLDELEVVLKNFVIMARLCLDKKWQETIPIFQKTIGLLLHDIKCFQEAREQNAVQNFGIDPQCIIDHLNQAAGLIKEIFNDIMNQQWSAIQGHVMEMIEVLKDIQNC